MPEEVRRILFNNNELVHALGSYRNAHPQFLPDGVIKHLTVTDDQVTVTMEVKYFASVNRLDIEIPQARLLETLIAYCIEHQIPLPRAGERSIAPDGERVAFEIRLNYEQVESKEAPTWGRIRVLNR